MAAESSRVDLHVHIASAAGLGDAAAAGIVLLRDAGTRGGAGLGQRSAGQPRVLSAGWALYKEGGYGSRFGVAVRNADDAGHEIRRLKDEGADIIKVMASGMVSLAERGVVTHGGFERQELERIVHEAASVGLTVMAHANGEKAIIGAAEAGVASIEHGFFMTVAALGVLMQRDVLWVPTVGALQRAAAAPNAPAGARAMADGIIADHLILIEKAFRSGVRLGIGTDCTLPDPKYREAYEAELEWFRKAGIPGRAVIQIAGEAGQWEGK